MLIEEMMKLALEEAKKAFDKNEVPVGAVIIKNGEVISRAHNLRETVKDPTAHAEIMAIRQAAEMLKDWRLSGCEMFVTLEPCPMCAGAILQSRISRLYFGAFDEKAGCCGSLYDIPEDPVFNHRTEVIGGILEEECQEILSQFFKKKRGCPV